MTSINKNKKQRFRVKKDPNLVIIKFDNRSLIEINEMAEELNTDTGEIINKAYHLFRLAQGRTVVLKEKKSTTKLTIKEFEKNKTRS